MNVALPRRSGFPATTRKRQSSTPCKHSSWRHTRAAGSDRSRNAALFSRAAPITPSRPTLRHANPVRSTQVPSTGVAYLHLCPNMVGLIHTKEG
jgi:hypothetical protein